MNRELRDITHNMTGRLRIGFPSERIIYMLPLLLAPLKARYPGLMWRYPPDRGII